MRRFHKTTEQQIRKPEHDGGRRGETDEEETDEVNREFESRAARLSASGGSV